MPKATTIWALLFAHAGGVPPSKSGWTGHRVLSGTLDRGHPRTPPPPGRASCSLGFGLSTGVGRTPQSSCVSYDPNGSTFARVEAAYSVNHLRDESVLGTNRNRGLRTPRDAARQPWQIPSLPPMTRQHPPNEHMACMGPRPAAVSANRHRLPQLTATHLLRRRHPHSLV